MDAMTRDVALEQAIRFLTLDEVARVAIARLEAEHPIEQSEPESTRESFGVLTARVAAE